MSTQTTEQQTREIKARYLKAGMTVIDGTDGPLLVTGVSRYDAVSRYAADNIIVSFEGQPEPTLFGIEVAVNVVDEPQEHRHVAGSGGAPGECSAECACGVTFDGFDTIGEAVAQLDRHIAQPDPKPTTYVERYMSCPRNCGVDVRKHNSSDLIDGQCDTKPDYWLTLADDLRQAADKIATLAGTAAPTWVRLDIVGVAPQDASEASATIIDALADGFGTEARTSDGGTVRRYGMGARHGVVDVNGYTYLPLEDSELKQLRARVAELESQLAEPPANPDRRCRRCGAISGLRLLTSSPLELAAREWECTDSFACGAR